MTPAQILLVQSSFEKVVPIAPQAAELFYGRLFEILPEARPMFKADLADQGRKLMTTLGTVVRSLDRLDQIMPAVKSLAVRHIPYGVKPEHYPPVGAALLWTLEKGLGADFTPEVSQAWATAYGALSTAMIQAARPQTADA
jgi:hemoglobin-like flavoprotein